MDKKATNNSNRLIAIELCIFLSGLSVFSQLYLYQPLLSVIATEFHTTIGNSSILVSSSTVGMAVGLLFFAFKADNYSRKQLMFFSLLSSSLLTLLSFWIDNLTVLILIGFLKGFLLSGVSAVVLAYIIEEVSLTVLGTVFKLILEWKYLRWNVWKGYNYLSFRGIWLENCRFGYWAGKFIISSFVLEIFSRISIFYS